MSFYSTNRRSSSTSLKAAVLKGLADDNGLFMPTQIPVMPKDFIKNISALSFKDIAYNVANSLFYEDIPPTTLRGIIDESINFDAPLVQLSKNVYVLELYHGPTLAFKDFGARFMATLMAYFTRDIDREVHILVATSGDTGSAVAHSFLNTLGIRVIILYPSRKVSTIQEKQLTTMGNNIIALEVDGTFDDCQKLVKGAFLDIDLKQKLLLTSANSINIARLIPQSFYYFYAYAQLKDRDNPTIFSVPSGNFGNLTGGLMAKKMGLPVSKFVAATNANDIFPKYLHSGFFEPGLSIKTLSSAMDVGNPSNFARISTLYDNDVKKMRRDIFSMSFSDDDTQIAIQEVFQKYKYLLDPHSAVGYLGLKRYCDNNPQRNNGIFIATAHPAKFLDIVQNLVDTNVEMPKRLQEVLNKKKQSVMISNKFDNLKQFLLNLN